MCLSDQKTLKSFSFSLIEIISEMCFVKYKCVIKKTFIPTPNSHNCYLRTQIYSGI